MSSYLVVGVVKHYQGGPKGDKKPYVTNERCNNYNNENKGCNVEQRFNRICVCRHACSNCDKLGHLAYKCPNASNPPKSVAINPSNSSKSTTYIKASPSS